MHRLTLATIMMGASALTAPTVARAQEAAPVSAQSGQSSASAGTSDAGTSDTSDDIVVTAQKRSENVQQVPINIMAFTGATLTQAGVNSPSDLQRIAPSFRSTSVSGTLATRFSIRGVGTFGNSAIEPSVATFIDGIYAPRTAAIVNSALDIESVEVLSGPQGTLFGRNASVGALSFHTGTPSTEALSYGAKGEYSTGERFRAEQVLNVPLSDSVAVRVAGLADTFKGYWFNDLNRHRFGGIDTYQGRVSLKAKLAPALTWVVRADYQKNNGTGELNYHLEPSSVTPTTLARLTAEQGGIVPNLNQFSRHNNFYDNHFKIDDKTFGLSSDLSFSTEGDLTIRLLDGYYNWNSKQSDGDTANLSVYVLGRDLKYHSKSNSHELQFISPKDRYLDGKLDFVGGLYYFHENLFIRADGLNGDSFCSVAIPLAGLPFGTQNPASPFFIPGATTAAKIATCQAYPNPESRGDFDQRTRSLAAYGQATFKILPTVELTGGIRYTDDKKTADLNDRAFNPTGFIISANEVTSLALKENKFTYRGNLAWHVTPQVMLFGTVSTGFKSGGFNNGVAGAVLGQARIFGQESTTNYELGLKSQFFDRRLTFNLTGYRMDIDNFQERSTVNTTSTIRNVGTVRQQGFELDSALRATSFLRLNAAVTYVDSKIRSYNNAPLPPYCPANLATATLTCPVSVGGTQNLAGKPLTYNPKWQGIVGATVDSEIGQTGWRASLNGDVNFFTSQYQGTVIDGNKLLKQSGYALFNARLTLFGPDDKYSVGVFGRNLTKKGYCAAQGYQVFEGPLGLRYENTGDGVNDGTAIRCSVGAPRVIGVAVGLKF